uniref:cysteine dioxygenase n=1 Tax=Lactuca sativa TaxID=4236 RepID=A0A9R1XLA0_LACSA|nr:hypothetical protein LSAT_V11C400168000 [Lactuca sativa]
MYVCMYTFRVNEHIRTNQSLPPIKYIHIHECDKFCLRIFCMSPSSIIPLHNHPRIIVFSKLLYVSMHAKAYGQPAKLVKDGMMTGPIGTPILFPTCDGNIHYFHVMKPCAIFDILSPSYSSDDMRHYMYF